MKTFETEKNNIPEGATHYSEEDKRHLFTWFKVGDAVEFYNNSTNKWQLVGAHINCLKVRITPIPEPEVVEWKNGDECDYKGDRYFFVGKVPVDGTPINGDCIIQHEKGAPLIAHIDELSKPESPEEKEQRERLEAAYDLYSSWVSNSYGEPLFCFKAFCDAPDLCAKWLAIVEKTNYRKGE